MALTNGPNVPRVRRASSSRIMTPLGSLQAYITMLDDMLEASPIRHTLNKAPISLVTLHNTQGREQGLGTHSRPKKACGLEARVKGMSRLTSMKGALP